MKSHSFLSFPPLWIPFPFIFVPLSLGFGGWCQVIDLSLHLTIFFLQYWFRQARGRDQAPVSQNGCVY